MTKLTSLLILLFLGMTIVAQEPDIPDDIKLEQKEDYDKTEKLVLESIEWIHNTPLSENSAKRKKVNAFLLKWMTGSPTVTIELVSGLVPLDCADCLLSFMGGWTEYSLENNYSKDNVKCALAGVNRSIEIYEKNKGLMGKKADIEKLIKLKKKGKLESFVESKLG